MQLLNRRRLMGEKLPYDYEVKWLQRFGAQYINTGVKANNTTRLITKVYDVQPLSSALFGCRVSAGKQMFYVLCGSGNNGQLDFQVAWGNSSNFSKKVNIGDNITIDINKNKAYVNNTLYYTFTNGFTTANLNIYLFALNQNNGTVSGNECIAKIGNTQIYQNNVLVRDFIPVAKDGKGYMFDKVEEKLYGNLGEGDFTIGERI